MERRDIKYRCTFHYKHLNCHDPNFGHGKVWVENATHTFHTPGSARECEGMSPNIFKWTPTLVVGDPMESQIFK